jgi:hypothetical protein
MRLDEVTVNQEADDHHLSCSCPCSRHRGAKSPKRRITEAPKQCHSAFVGVPVDCEPEQESRWRLEQQQEALRPSKAAQGRCLEPQQYLEQETRCLKQDVALALRCLKQEEEQEMWWSLASW